MEWLTAAGIAFVAIAPVELPDKTFIATLLLATRFRPLPVWLGAASAFALHCAIAVVAGSLFALLPPTPVRLVAAGLFAAGAVIMWRAARGSGEVARQQREFEEMLADPDEPAPRTSRARAALAAYGGSFLLLFTAEWGDLSQVFTMALVASGEPATAVFAGAWLALATVSGAAILVGRWVSRRVRLTPVRYVAAAICATLAVITAGGAFA